MFPEFEKKLIKLYILSTTLILTVILAITFLFYASSQQSRRESDFLDHIFTLSSRFQTDSTFTDTYLANMEAKYHLLIYIEENDTPFFFPGAYTTATDRSILFKKVSALAAEKGICKNSHPVSSDFLQSGILEIRGKHHDSYLGDVVVMQGTSGYKKLILLQNITLDKLKLFKIGSFYFLVDILGIILLYLAGKRFVRRSLIPLEEMYQKQQDFAAAASHELRSPLALIQSAADALTHYNKECIPRTNLTDERRLLSIIHDECVRGNRLVKNLLFLASSHQEQWAVKKQHFELDEMLFHLLELYEPLFSEKNAALLLELPEKTLAPVFADPDLCLQIFTILLDNVIAHALTDTKNSSKVILCITQTKSQTTVAIIDHGPGLSAKEKQRIFEPFYRKDSARSEKEHFGLGLSIAAKLTNLQDIHLNVTDTDGGGCTFKVFFPS